LLPPFYYLFLFIYFILFFSWVLIGLLLLYCTFQKLDIAGDQVFIRIWYASLSLLGKLKHGSFITADE